jgi:hypothetical protein
MTTAFTWQPDPNVLERVLDLAQQQGRSPDAIVTEAVKLYLKNPPEDLSDRLPNTPLTLEQRRAFIKLPLQERHRILQAQTEAIVTHYQQDTEWRELQTGDLFEYY